ncbi:MAG: OmpH family outer membrane protein [Acidobacteria bacterium]|nr:OmpH family outer membrane protein [Acidobacteriota bacterium]MCZ6650608.1 OmpH family outer membrane protein [Acidobacteriota bacterium]
MSRRILTLAALAAILLLPGLAPAQETLKVGVFDSKVVFAETAEGQRLQKVLNDKREEFRGEIQIKEQGIRELQQKLKEGEFTLSDDRKSLMQKNLQQKLVQLDSAKQEANTNLRIELEDVQNQLDRKLLEIIEAVGEKQNFSLIFESNTQVVYAAAAVDISQMVVDLFNESYPPAGGEGN